MATCSKQLTLFFAWTLLKISQRVAKERANADKWRKENPERKKALDKRHYWKNRDAELLHAKEWVKNHPEETRATKKRWIKNNPEKISAMRSKRNKVRRATDPNWKLRKLYRDQIYHALKGSRKSAKGQELLGCPFELFRTHIEKQFVPGMTWENHGTAWELDHILPCAEFQLQHSEEQEICFHWTNFQPLFVSDNRAKGDKVL